MPDETREDPEEPEEPNVDTPAGNSEAEDGGDSAVLEALHVLGRAVEDHSESPDPRLSREFLRRQGAAGDRRPPPVWAPRRSGKRSAAALPSIAECRFVSDRRSICQRL